MSTSPSILVADGNRDCADVVAMMLRSSGARTTVAYDGATALMLGTQDRFDAAVMDLALPRTSGFSVAHELRRFHGPAIKLVAYTAWAEGYAGGQADVFDEVVSKTSEPVELLRVACPEFHAELLRSERARVRQVGLELTLANSMLDCAALYRSQENVESMRALLSRRVVVIERSLARLLRREDREPLAEKLKALRSRLDPGRGT